MMHDSNTSNINHVQNDHEPFELLTDWDSSNVADDNFNNIFFIWITFQFLDIDWILSNGVSLMINHHLFSLDNGSEPNKQ